MALNVAATPGVSRPDFWVQGTINQYRVLTQFLTADENVSRLTPEFLLAFQDCVYAAYRRWLSVIWPVRHGVLWWIIGAPCSWVSVIFDRLNVTYSETRV